MKTKLAFLLLGSILLLAPGCIFIPSIKGNKNVTTHTIDISNYDKIQLFAPAATVIYSQQQEAAPSLTVTVDQNIFDLFDFATEGNTLYIGTKDEKLRERIRPTQFTITTNSTGLRKVDMASIETFNVTGKLVSTDKVKLSMAGKGTINMEDSVMVDELEIRLAGSFTTNIKSLLVRKFDGDIAGNATLNLAGKGEKASINIAGKGKVNAFDFELSEISCSIAGKGTLNTFAKDRIKAEIAGIGNIYYKGDPSVNLKKAGLGKIKKVD